MDILRMPVSQLQKMDMNLLKFAFVPLNNQEEEPSDPILDALRCLWKTPPGELHGLWPLFLKRKRSKDGKDYQNSYLNLWVIFHSEEEDKVWGPCPTLKLEESSSERLDIEIEGKIFFAYPEEHGDPGFGQEKDSPSEGYEIARLKTESMNKGAKNIARLKGSKKVD